MGRPWAPRVLTRLPRWRAYGPDNPLIPEPEQAVRVARYLRPPGRWFRRWEAASLARSLLPAAARIHAADPVDAILACPLLPDGVAAVAVKRHLRRPLAVLAIGSDVLVYPRQQPVLETQLGRTLGAADLSVAVSGHLRKRLVAFGARDPLCIYLGRQGGRFEPVADRAALRRRLGLDPKALIACFVGRLCPAKGCTELTAAVAELAPRRPELRLVCVGEGPSRRDLAALGPVVHLAGERPPEDVPAFLQAADLLVLPSHSEGMPQVVLEAMDCGLPIVATAVGGIPEAVVDGDNGLLLAPGDPDALAAALERLITDTAFRKRAGRQSHARARAQFDGPTHTARLARALHGLAIEGAA